MQPLRLQKYDDVFITSSMQQLNFSDIHGQETAKRALEIAAASRYDFLFNGPPGASKTMLVKALVSILPDPSLEKLVPDYEILSLALG